MPMRRRDMKRAVLATVAIAALGPAAPNPAAACTCLESPDTPEAVAAARGEAEAIFASFVCSGRSKYARVTVGPLTTTSPISPAGSSSASGGTGCLPTCVAKPREV